MILTLVLSDPWRWTGGPQDPASGKPIQTNQVQSKPIMSNPNVPIQTNPDHFENFVNAKLHWITLIQIKTKLKALHIL